VIATWEVHERPQGRSVSIGPYLVAQVTPPGELTRLSIRSMAYLRGVETPETFWKYLSDLCRQMTRALGEM
jgi:hypothetical protein